MPVITCPVCLTEFEPVTRKRGRPRLYCKPECSDKKMREQLRELDERRRKKAEEKAREKEQSPGLSRTTY